MSLSKIVEHLSKLGSTSDDASFIALLDEEFLDQMRIALMGFPIVFVETKAGQEKEALHLMLGAAMDKYLAGTKLPKNLTDEMAFTGLGSFASEIITKEEGKSAVNGRLVAHLLERTAAKQEPVGYIIDATRGFNGKDGNTAELQLLAIAAMTQFIQGKSVTVAHASTPARSDIGKTGLEVDSPCTYDGIKRLIVILPPPQADLMPKLRICGEWRDVLTGTKAAATARSGISKLFTELFDKADGQAAIIRTLH